MMAVKFKMDKVTMRHLEEQIKKIGARPISDAIRPVFVAKTKDIRKDAKRNLRKGRVQRRWVSLMGKPGAKRFGILTGALMRHLWRGRFERRNKYTYMSAGVGIRKGAALRKAPNVSGPASMLKMGTVKVAGRKVRQLRPVIPTNYAHWIEFGFKHKSRSGKITHIPPVVPGGFLRNAAGNEHRGNFADTINRTERAVKKALGL